MANLTERDIPGDTRYARVQGRHSIYAYNNHNNNYLFIEDSTREFEGMLIVKNALRHYVGGKEAGKVNS